MYSFLQNVSPAVLIRFLREHRSEWADSNIDAYSAAAVKAGPCSLPGPRIGGFGSQVILPLAHTIEHEEVVISLSLSRVCVGTVPFIKMVERCSRLTSHNGYWPDG